MRWLTCNTSPMVTWDPFADLNKVLASFGPVQSGRPAVDIAEDEANYTVTVETPGFEKDQIEVEVREDALIIRGKANEEKKDESKRQLFTERSSRNFERAFRLPEAVDTTKAQANYANGVLTIKLPKAKVEEKSTKLEIK